MPKKSILRYFFSGDNIACSAFSGENSVHLFWRHPEHFSLKHTQAGAISGKHFFSAELFGVNSFLVPEDLSSGLMTLQGALRSFCLKSGWCYAVLWKFKCVDQM